MSNEQSYRDLLWCHKPITDFWRVGPGIARRLEALNCLTMGDVARLSEQNEAALSIRKKRCKPRYLSGWSRRLWADGIGVAALLPLQAQKGTLPGLRLGRNDLHLRVGSSHARSTS